MKRIRNIIKQNKGFSLIELLVAIGILSVLMVPLFNSFLIAGKTARNSRELQDATAVAQSVVEHAKRTTDLDELYAVLNNMKGVSNFNKTSTDMDAIWTADMNVEGGDTEKFLVKLSLSPKNDYDYREVEFADVYNEANVLYSEIILYDNTILSLIKNEDIPYGTTALQTYKWNGAGWSAWTPADEDKALRVNYGNLFADEYVGSAIAGESNPTFTKMYEKFKKENISKTISIVIGQSGDTYNVTLDTEYAIDYEVVYRAEDPAVTPVLPDSTPMAFYMYKGSIKYAAPQITLTYDSRLPIYVLYAKAAGKTLAPDGITIIDADPRHFKSVTCNITYDNTVALTGAGGMPKNAELYLVEQAGDITDSEFKFKIANQSSSSVLDIYTTENYLSGSVFNSIEITEYGMGAAIYSSKDASNEDNHVAYKKKGTITALYKITAMVYYDTNHDGSYTDDEMLYSVTTED